MSALLAALFWEADRHVAAEMRAGAAYAHANKTLAVLEESADH